MRARRRFQGLATAVAVAVVLAVPVGASASPEWRINGVLAGAIKQDVVLFGTLTLDNTLFGEYKCKVVAGLTVDSESEKGFAAIETSEPFDCSARECKVRPS